VIDSSAPSCYVLSHAKILFARSGLPVAMRSSRSGFRSAAQTDSLPGQKLGYRVVNDTAVLVKADDDKPAVTLSGPDDDGTPLKTKTGTLVWPLSKPIRNGRR
jgi:hypothetical protein